MKIPAYVRILGLMLCFLSSTKIAASNNDSSEFNRNDPQQGYQNLLAALSLLNNKSPISVELNSSFSDQHDESYKTGNVSAVLSADERGFQLLYPINVLDKINDERVALAKLMKADDTDLDTNALTPTLSAAKKLKVVELERSLNMANELALLIQRATFIPNQSNYSPTKKSNTLAFSLPIDMLLSNKKTRKYVKEFTASYKLNISDDGTPVSSELTFEGNGSAYLVLQVEAYGRKSETYQVIDDRLILADLTSSKGSKSIFGDFERNETKTLRLFNEFNN